jgi:isopentenyl-diphosphate Delta-isomerase
MQLNPAEVAATRWVDLPTLIRETSAAPQLFTPWLRIYLTEHATQIFGTVVH